MIHFRYTARDRYGSLLEGTIQATSSTLVARQLMENQLIPIEISKIKQVDFSDYFYTLFMGRLPNLSEMILLCHQLYSLTKAGIPLIKALQGLASQQRNPRLVRVLNNVIEDLNAGYEFSAALSRHPKLFSSLFINTIQVGESSGKLEYAFAQLAEYLTKDKELRERIKAAIRYPLIVIFAMCIAVAVINVLVIPAFSKVFQSAHLNLPWQTQLIVQFSNFTLQYWVWILVGLFGGLLGIHWLLQTPSGSYWWDRFKLSLPIFGNIIRRATLARFARALAMALSAGIPITQALRLVAQAVDNRYLEQRILMMCIGLERGDSLIQTARATHIFTPIVLQMMEIGDESGSIEHLLTEVAEFYEREVDYDIKNLSSLIEPILLVFIGIMVLILALGVFLPMWDLMNIYRR